MFNILAQFKHKTELRESKDEILIGEIVRAMARAGHPSISFQAHSDRQMVRFKTLRDPVLYSVHIVLDRKSGTSALSAAIIGSKATPRVTAEIRNRLTDPDDLVAMYKTDLANLFKIPVMGGVKLNHELDSVFATTTRIIEIDDYVFKGEAGVDKMTALLTQTIDKLKQALEPYKR